MICVVALFLVWLNPLSFGLIFLRWMLLWRGGVKLGLLKLIFEPLNQSSSSTHLTESYHCLRKAQKKYNFEYAVLSYSPSSPIINYLLLIFLNLWLSWLYLFYSSQSNLIASSKKDSRKTHMNSICYIHCAVLSSKYIFK